MKPGITNDKFVYKVINNGVEDEATVIVTMITATPTPTGTVSSVSKTGEAVSITFKAGISLLLAAAIVLVAQRIILKKEED